MISPDDSKWNWQLLGQLSSSDPSPQSFWPSHKNSRLIHFPFEQWKVPDGQASIIHKNGNKASQVVNSHSWKNTQIINLLKNTYNKKIQEWILSPKKLNYSEANLWFIKNFSEYAFESEIYSSLLQVILYQTNSIFHQLSQNITIFSHFFLSSTYSVHVVNIKLF